MSSTGVHADRLDILGLGEDGRLVVAELKRDDAPDTVEMQAIKYAAYASRFQPDTLAGLVFLLGALIAHFFLNSDAWH